MANTPRYVGFTLPPYTRIFTDENGAALDLTGCTSNNFTLTMLNMGVNPLVARQGTGVWTVGNQATNKGQASYFWTAADVATSGLWDIYATVKLPTEPSPREMDPERIEIKAGTVGAGAAPPGVLPAPVPGALVFDIAAYGGTPDGITDSTTAIFNARAAARTAGGGVIFYHPGTYISGNQDISNDANIYHLGSGKHATVIKLKNGANTDLFSGQTSLIDFTPGLNGITGTLYDFGFANMTIDGNKANQTAGPSCCLRFYGLSYIFENLEVKNGYTDNIVSCWNGFNNFAPADSMMAFWNGVKSHDSNGRAVVFGGPHDSKFENCEFYINGGHTLHLTPNATGVSFVNLHAWQRDVGYSNLTAYDTDFFARANQSGLGNGWVESPASGGANAAIVSNQANFSGNGTASSYFRKGSGSQNDMIVTARMNLGGDAANNSIGVLFRYTDINNYYAAYYYQGNIYLQKKVAGVVTVLGSAGFAAQNNTYYWIAGYVKGTTLQIKIWQDGQNEQPAWTLTRTDSAFASGGWGMTFFVNTGTIIADNFYAQSIPAPSGIVTCLQEAYGCLFSNCVIESSDTVQWVCLGSGSVFEGGAIYDITNNTKTATGIKLGQHAGEVPYAGQILQSGGLTIDRGVNRCRISTALIDNHGDNGSLWLDNDNGDNTFDLTIAVDLKGTDVTGALHARSVLRETYDDGTRTTSGQLLLNSGIQLNKAATIYSGSGAPDDTTTTKGSVNGCFYFRIDTPGTVNQRLYVKSAGTWSGIV